jgi:hypothetical protein
MLSILKEGGNKKQSPGQRLFCYSTLLGFKESKIIWECLWFFFCYKLFCASTVAAVEMKFWVFGTGRIYFPAGIPVSATLL